MAEAAGLPDVSGIGERLDRLRERERQAAADRAEAKGLLEEARSEQALLAADRARFDKQLAEVDRVGERTAAATKAELEAGRVLGRVRDEQNRLDRERQNFETRSAETEAELNGRAQALDRREQAVAEREETLKRQLQAKLDDVDRRMAETKRLWS